MQVTTIGLDIAKNVFQVHGIDAKEKVVVRKRLRRGQVIAFFKALPPCLVGMEACASAHYWARGGTLNRIHHALYVGCRERAEREASPTACIIDACGMRVACAGASLGVALKMTDTEKLACVEREIAMRRRVYPRRVYNCQLSQEDADREIAFMEAIARDYRARIDGPDLFHDH
jgi:hypothetical protein